MNTPVYTMTPSFRIQDNCALWFTGPGQVALRAAPQPKTSKGHCVVQALYSLPGPGSARLELGGQVPADIADEMRVAHMGGDFSFPLRYGYSLVGRVVDGPASHLNRLIHCLHPHMAWCSVPVEEAALLPDALPPRRATLAASMETALSIAWDANVQPGDRVLLIGFGLIGSLVARILAAIPGVDLDILEQSSTRCELARQLGFVASPGVDPRALESQNCCDRYDTVINATASGEALYLAFRLLRREGRAIHAGWSGTATSELNLGTEFHSRRLRLICSQTSHIPQNRSAGWNHRRRRKLALRLLAVDAAYDYHLGPDVPFAHAPSRYIDLIHSEQHLAGTLRYTRAQPDGA